jgi:pyridoxal phosphate enzyme (YggS family)
VTRREEIARGLASVEERIGRACDASGRSREEITLVVVTKYFPASDIDLLVDLGVRAVGENKDQEARAKLAEVAARDRIEVHFVGQLQSNKAASVARYADVVHSVDRMRLVRALDRGVQRADRGGGRVTALVQVSLDGAEGRAGALPQDVPALADEVAASGLRLGGVMAVAPLDEDPDVAFARLEKVSHDLRGTHPDASWISAGMSADLEHAVAHGATHLRVGSAILGSRPPHR